MSGHLSMPIVFCRHCLCDPDPLSFCPFTFFSLSEASFPRLCLTSSDDTYVNLPCPPKSESNMSSLYQWCPAHLCLNHTVMNSLLICVPTRLCYVCLGRKKLCFYLLDNRVRVKDNRTVAYHPSQTEHCLASTVDLEP